MTGLNDKLLYYISIMTVQSSVELLTSVAAKMSQLISQNSGLALKMTGSPKNEDSTLVLTSSGENAFKTLDVIAKTPGQVLLVVRDVPDMDNPATINCYSTRVTTLADVEKAVEQFPTYLRGEAQKYFGEFGFVIDPNETRTFQRFAEMQISIFG